ncbi:MAG: hypothetical protein HQK73_02045 [Desulfamplus sp.]|nr:hypothetical protein [Desulfamplus sp.]
MRTNPIFAVLIALSFTIILSSCGYTLQGGGKLTGNVKSVSVMIFQNKSSESGAEVIFTNALIEELMRSSSVRVVESGRFIAKDKINSKQDNQQINDVDAVIHGTIVSISFDALARTSEDVVYKRGLNAVVNVQMKSRNGDILFSLNNFTESESYSVTHSNLIDESVLKSTLETVADRFARRVVSQMTDDF